MCVCAENLCNKHLMARPHLEPANEEMVVDVIEKAVMLIASQFLLMTTIEKAMDIVMVPIPVRISTNIYGRKNWNRC